MVRDCNFGRDKRETISGDGYEDEYEEEESDSDEETDIISAPLDSDEERKDSDIENYSDCVNITNIAVDKETFVVPNNEQNLFETCTRVGRRAGSWRKSLDEWLD